MLIARTTPPARNAARRTLFWTSKRLWWLAYEREQQANCIPKIARRSSSLLCAQDLGGIDVDHLMR
jgi:hypothetical protein